VEISTTSGSAIIDSVNISGNYVSGSGIQYAHTGTGGNRYGERVYIRNNVVENAWTPGIDVVVPWGTLRKVFLDSNYVSQCRTGIVLRNVPSNGYTAATRQVFIRNNTLVHNDSCGVAVQSLPLNAHATMDSVHVLQNRIDSNLYDGMRLWSLMGPAGKLNFFRHFNIRENVIRSNSGNGIAYTHFGDTSSALASPVLSHFTFSRNSIYENGQSGIEIQNMNDPGYPPTPMFPVPQITAIDPIPVGFAVKGTLQGNPNTLYRFELFRNDMPDPSGEGEGEVFLTDSVTLSDASGSVVFELAVPGTFGNYYYTTTATNLVTGNSSEFSNAADFTVGIAGAPWVASIYPNPVQDVVQFSMRERSQYELMIFDALTRLVSRYIFTSQITINLSSLQPGVFIYILRDREGRLRKEKFLKL
jgi:hypothetical protein